MEEKPKINNCDDIAHCSNHEPNSEVTYQNIITENEEINYFSVVSKLEDTVYNDGASKTFILAENIEVYEPNYHKEIPAEIIFHEPVDLTKPHRTVHFIQDEKLADSDNDSSTLHSIKSNEGVEFNPNDISYNILRERHNTEHQSEVYKEMPTTPSQSLESLLLESNIYETATNKENTAAIEISENNSTYSGVEPIIVQVNDGHKDFKVQNVDESQLALDHETMNAKIAIKDNQVSNAGQLFQVTPSTLLDEASPSTDINYQDTIGPLDNPAFLRTLHYSVSHQPPVNQPFVQDELTGLKSNFDIRSLSVLQDPCDLDKGWAWVVLGAGFIASALLGASIYASGVFILAILEDINPDLTKASWVGSLFVCSMCISGPLVEIATTQFGTRVTVFCASIVTSVGFVGASFARNISELIITHGLIAGVGSGFIANPISVSVGQYFIRYRGLACGLMASGAGIGMLTGGAIISLLLDEYGLSGTYLIWAGMMLHTAVLALLLRPSPEERLRALEKKIAVKKYHQQVNSLPDAYNGFNSVFGSVNHSMLSGIDKISYGKRFAASRNYTKIRSGDPHSPFNAGHEMSHLTHNQSHPNSHMTKPFQHHTFGESFVSGDLQNICLSDSPTVTPKTNKPPNASLCNQYTLASCVPHYGSTTILTASDPAHFTPSFTSKSTCGIDKIGNGKIYTGHSNLSKIINGDHIPITKPALPHELSNSSQTEATNQSHLKPHVTSSSLRSKFSQSFDLGDRQFESLPTTPLAASKSNSPPTILSVSQNTLTSDLDNSPSSSNVNILLESDYTHPGFTSNSPPISPPSILSHLPHNKIQHRQVSQGSLSQQTWMSHSSLRISLRGSLQPSHIGEMDSESITSALVSQARHRDVLTKRYPLGSRSFTTLMGSVPSIPIALAIVKDDVSRYETFSIAGVHEKGFKGRVIKILDSMRLLRRKPFFIFLAICFVWSFGEAPVMIYLPSYAISLGTSPFLASLLYTSMGTGSIVGRFLSGLTATDSSIGPAVLFTGCLGVAGLLISLGPFITSTFIEQIIFSGLAGIYTGALVPLSSLIAIDMLEMGELGIGFGFISLAQGLGYLIGPPLASIIVRSIGYRNSFVFSGLVLISGSVMALFMSSFLRDTGDEEQENHNQTFDLMKPLQKITDNNHEQVGNSDVDNISRILPGSVNTMSEVKESSRVVQVDGVLIEGSKEASRSHDHHSNEEKLGTIMEVS